MRISTRPVSLVIASAVALAVMALPVAASALPSIPSLNFPSATGCGCHADLFEQWSPSMHAQALTDPIYLTKLAEADAATDGEVTPFCLSCHTPVGIMAGEVTGLDHSVASGVAAEGTTCTFCHHTTGTNEPVGNASQVVSPEDVRVAQIKDPQAAHEAAYSEFHETAEFCGACHNVVHPTSGVHLEATYKEWKEGPYSAEGTVCQDCHMTPGPGVTKPNPGKAASTGPDRDHIYTMTFAGGNVALGDAEKAEERLKAAAQLELELPEIVESGDVAVKATITNVGAGHYLPTGLTEVRQMWLEVTATDAEGAELMLERRDFGTVMKDAEGDYPAEMWEAVEVQTDDRIPPRESTSSDYSFAMAEGAVTVKAALYYRSCSEEIAEKAEVDVPTTTMAEITKTVYSSAEAMESGEQEPIEPGGDAPAADDTSTDGLGTTGLLLIAAGVLVVAGVVFVIVKRRSTK
ncbi:MAG: multiheme c-type cytochrome [Coriobacteriia bacterium]|nr:multiheme c-type cytochrome [Coriobacteriia bacterium]